MSLFLLSDVLSMGVASQLGLVDVVIDNDQAYGAVQGVVQRLSQLPGREAKTLFLNRSTADLAAQLERERDVFLQCARTPRFRERVLAFAAR